MTWALIRKEFAAHWLPFLALFVITGAVYLLMLFAAAFDSRAYTGLRLFLLVVAPVVAWGVSSRLVAREFAGRTQLFLEALPVSRTRVLLVKLVLGFALFGGAMMTAALLAALVDARHVDADATSVRIVLTRVAVYVVFLHAVCFLLNLLGRYRVACLLLMFVAFFFIDSQTSLDLGSQGPFALVDETLGFEREALVQADILWTLVASAALLAVAFFLALGREGSVAARLAHQMSYREKAFVASGLVLTLFLSWLVGEKLPQAPFELPGAVEREADGVFVSIAPTGALSMEQASHLAERTRDELVELRDYLGAEELPPVFVVSWPGIDGGQYEVGEVEDAEGLVLRIHLGDPTWDEDRYVSWLVWEVLERRTHGRVLREPKRWVFDAFGLHWVRRRSDDPRSREWLLAAYAAGESLEVDDLDAWRRTRERVGKDLARELAWSGLAVLAQEQGEDAVRALMREVVGADVPEDLRALFHPSTAPLADHFDEHCRIPYSAFVEGWAARLKTVRVERAAELAAVPTLQAELTSEVASDLTSELTFKLRSEPPLAADTLVQFRWVEIGPFDYEIARPTERVFEVPYRVASEGRVLHQLLPRGGRVAWRMTVDAPDLPFRLTTPWRREAVE